MVPPGVPFLFGRFWRGGPSTRGIAGFEPQGEVALNKTSMFYHVCVMSGDCGVVRASNSRGLSYWPLHPSRPAWLRIKPDREYLSYHSKIY